MYDDVMKIIRIKYLINVVFVNFYDLIIKVSSTDRVRNNSVLQRMGKSLDVLNTIKRGS